MKNSFEKYKKNFSELSFWTKIKKYARQAGLKTAYTGLLLFYAYKRKDTPAWAKRLVLGVLGYFIAPIDALPDLTPFVGYTDDLGILSFALVTISCYIDDEVKYKAETQLSKWFDQLDKDDLQEVNKQLEQGS